jgi:chromosome segregation ATPase
LKTKLDELNEEYQSRNDYEHDELMTKSFEAEITKLKGEIEHLKTATISIDGNETKKENECEQPTSINNISQKLLDTKNEEIDDLHAEMARLQQEANEKVAQLEQALIDLAKQKELVLELNLKLEEKINSNESLQKRLDTLVLEKDSTFDQIRQLELIKSENEKLSSDLAQLNELNTEYKDLLDQYDLKMEELTKENDGLKAEKTRLNEHIEIKEKIIENLNAEINEMNQIKFDMEKEQSEHSEASKTESIPIETFNEQRVLGKLNFKP